MVVVGWVVIAICQKLWLDCLDRVANEMGIITHCLRVKSGGNTSAMILLLIKYKYALSNNQIWREHVSRYHGAAHEI